MPEPTTQSPIDNECCNAALEYLERGFSVIPVKRSDKKPYVKWEDFQKRLPTADEIESWWQKWPEANVAIITGDLSGLFVVDADGDVGIAYMTKNLPPTTVYSKTGRGLHAFFRMPKNALLRNKVKISPEIDVRGEGGYVVASPSIHDNGNKYSWKYLLGGWDDLPEYQPPTARMDKANGNLNLDLSTVKISPINQPVAKGSRNATLAALAGKWIGAGLDDAEIDILAKTWNTYNIPPLSEKELCTTLASIRKTHERNHPIIEVVPLLPDSEKRGFVAPVPDFLMHPGGLLQEILDYLDSMCPVSVPAFNLGCSIALIGAVGGHKICGPTGIRTNLYCLLLGHSGSGKDGAPSLVKQILSDTPDLMHFMGGSKFTGGAAIYSAVSLIPDKYSKIFFLDEFAKVLKRERSKNNTAETVGSAFLELYSGASGEKSYADTSNNKKYPWQHVAMIGSATPDDLWAQITPTDLQDGFIARLQVFESHHDPISAEYEMPLYYENKPHQLIKKLVEISSIEMQFDPDCVGNIETNAPTMKKYVPFKLTRTPEALEYLKQWDNDTNKKQCLFKGKWQGYIYNRARETGEKYAHCHHLSKYGKKCISFPLGVDSYQYGLTLIDHLNNHILSMAGNYVSENDWHAMEQKILRAIQGKATPDKPGVSQAVLFGQMVKVPERDRKPLIAGLLSTGQLYMKKHKGKAGPETDILCLSQIAEEE